MQRAVITSYLPPPRPAGVQDNGSCHSPACPVWILLTNLATGHFIRQTKGSITLLPWWYPTIRMATASYKEKGNIPVTYRGRAEMYLIFRTGVTGNTNEYLTLGAPSVLAFLFLLHTFRKRNICLQMAWVLLLLCFSCHCFPSFSFLFCEWKSRPAHGPHKK